LLLLRRNSDGIVMQKISSTQGGFKGTLNAVDQFGYSVASLGDFNSDGIVDIVVGAPHDDTSAENAGAVWLLFLENDGAVQGQHKIFVDENGFGEEPDAHDVFGYSVASLGDLNQDGNIDIAVGAPGDDDGGTSAGAVWLLFLNNDGTVEGHEKIPGIEGDVETRDRFGVSVASLGDLNQDGNIDIAVGAQGDDDSGDGAGAV